MNLQERSYGGKLFRPRPEIHVSENSTLVIIATAWGEPQAASDFITSVSSQFRSSSDDTGQNIATIHVEGLNFNETLLRKAIYRAHDDIYEKYNDQILSAGVEFLCFLREGRNVTWFKVGAPYFAVIREATLMPLNHPVDFSFDYSVDSEQPLPPLPKSLVGTHEQIQLESGSLRLAAGDKFLIVSRSYVPASVTSANPQQMTLESATLALAKDNEELPFWIGLGSYN